MDSIISSRLENSPPSSPAVFLVRFRHTFDTTGFTYRRRNCECRRPCNCDSSKENGNFSLSSSLFPLSPAAAAAPAAAESGKKKCRRRALTGSKLSIEISITQESGETISRRRKHIPSSRGCLKIALSGTRSQVRRIKISSHHFASCYPPGK